MTEFEPALVVRRQVAASPERLFAAWTRPRLMRLWLAPDPGVVVEAENDLRVGGAFRVVSEGPDGSRHVITGIYEAIERDRLLRMTWRYSGPVGFLDGMETVLEVVLTAAGDGRTDMVLTQRRIPTAEARDAFEADWPTCFDKLDRTLEDSLH